MISCIYDSPIVCGYLLSLEVLWILEMAILKVKRVKYIKMKLACKYLCFSIQLIVHKEFFFMQIIYTQQIIAPTAST